MSQGWNFVIKCLACSAVLSASNTNIASTRLHISWGWVEGSEELIIKAFLETQNKKQNSVCLVLRLQPLLSSTWLHILVHMFCLRCWINDLEVVSSHFNLQSCPWKQCVLCHRIPTAWLCFMARRGAGTFLNHLWSVFGSKAVGISVLWMKRP